MDVRLSPEQRALRDSVAQAIGRTGPKSVADLADRERAAKLDAAIEASGWRELRAAADGANPLASAVEVALVAEELARGLADAPFLGPTLAADLRRLAGAPTAITPETVLLTADLTGPAPMPHPADPALAVAVDAGNAPAALALVPAATGAVLVTVPVAVTVPPVDLTRPSGLPVAGRAPAPVAGAHPLTKADIDRWTALGLALTSAELVGTMRGALQLARDYALVRQQYGKLIGSFQAVQHLLADAHVATEGSRSIALHAAWAVDALPPGEALAAASAAKAYCSRAARTVCETAIQVHGGIGNTWECLAHVFLRRAILSTDVLGGIGPSLDRVLAHRGLSQGQPGRGTGDHSVAEHPVAEHGVAEHGVAEHGVAEHGVAEHGGGEHGLR
jgi:alkylation response protein AidB-like acyl-CoA dehydrogenase